MTDAPRGPWDDYASPQAADQPKGPWDDYASTADRPQPAAPTGAMDLSSAAPRADYDGTETNEAFAGAVHQMIGTTLDAFGQGWQTYLDNMQGAGKFTPEDMTKLNKLGVLGPDSPNSVARATWQQIIIPSAAELDVMARAPGAMYAGVQSGLMSAGVPRDIVSIPDAFQGSPHMFSMAKPVESAVPSPIKPIEEGGMKRSAMSATGDPQIDAILKSPQTSAVIDNPVVDRSHSVPYTAGGSVPIADPTVYIDHRFPKEIEAPSVSDPSKTVKFDPAEPFVVHENVEQHTMELLIKGGMDDASAYRVAHYEFAEKAEGAWYRANDIDQAAAEKIYEPIMDRIQKGADDKPPENLYEKPYPHDNAHMANGPDAIDHRPTPDEIARARRIIGGDPDAPRVTGGPADTVANSLPVARDTGLIGPERQPGEIGPMQASHGAPWSRDIVVDESGRIIPSAENFSVHHFPDEGIFAAFDKQGNQIGHLADAFPEGAGEKPAFTAGVQVDRAWRRQGVATELYRQFGARHEGNIRPAGNSSDEAWAFWKRRYPDKLAEYIVNNPDIDAGDPEIKALAEQAKQGATKEDLVRQIKSAGAKEVPTEQEKYNPAKGVERDFYGVRLHGDHANVTDVNSLDPNDIEITHKNGVPVEKPRVMASDTGVPKDETISEPAGGRVATDKAGNIRMDLIDKPEAVLDVMRRAAAENGGENAFAEARRGQIPLGQAEAISQAMGVPVKDLDLQGIGRNLTNDGMVRTYVKAMVQSAENVSTLAKQVAINDSPENLIAFQEARMRHSVIQEQVAGLTAEWGRTGNVFQEFSDAVKGAKKVGAAVAGEADTRTPIEKLDDYLAGKKGEGVESVDNLRKMAKTLAGMDPQTEVPKMLADARKPGFFDKLFWLRSNNLISGFVTHSKYLAVNGSWMLWNSLVVKQAAALAGDVRALSDRDIARVYHGESAAEVAAMVRAFPGAIMAAARAVRDGVAPKLPGEIVKPGSGLAPGTGNPFESAFGHAAGEVVGLPGRGVTGIHTFYLTLGQRVSLEGLAYRQAAKEGAKPWTMDFWDRQADHAANPSPEALTQSVKDAYYGAFMSPLGEFGKGLSRAIGKTPLRWLIPFRHVPGIIIKAGQEMLPLAFGSEELRGNLLGKNGDIVRDLAIARLGLGSALGMWAVHHTLADCLTGDGPNDPKARAEWLLTHQPNSIRIGDRWISYARLGPIGDVMGIFANLGEIAPHIKDEEYGKAAAMGVVAGGRWLTDGAGMNGLSDMFDLMREPDRRGVNIASNFIGGFKPFASALNQSAAAFDPNMREARTFIDGLKIGIPGNAWGMGRESLPIKRDWLGNPVANPMQYSLLRNSPVNQDPLSAEMQRLDLNPTLPERMINKVKLGPAAYDRYQVLAGAPLSMQLHAMVNAPGWLNAPEGFRADAIMKTMRGARETAASAMKMENYGDLVAAPMEAKARRMTGAPPP